MDAENVRGASVWFYVSDDGQEKGCRPPEDTQEPTAQRLKYYEKHKEIIE